MILLTDNTEFARNCVPGSHDWRPCDVSALGPALATLAGEFFNTAPIVQAELAANAHWDYLLAVDCAAKSQYDVLSRLAVSGCDLPDRILCCAGSGDEFHGFKNRHWQACRGNIHLSAFVKPACVIPGAGAGFIVAAAVAALRTVESFDMQGETAAIKWVNDILVGGAKVGGVLARLQTQGDTTQSAVLGIGLNVEQRPRLKRDPFVPEAAALADFAARKQGCRHADVFPILMDSLGAQLNKLRHGQFDGLLDIYRRHSLVLGRSVTICEDRFEEGPRLIAEGLVESIGPGLELYLKDHPKPVTNGRLRLGNLS